VYSPHRLLFIHALLTAMDPVLGVQQNPLSMRVPHVESWLQPPSQFPPLQKPTFWVAPRHSVPGALRHLAPPVYTVQSPPQTLKILRLQYVTVVAKAARGLRALMGSPTKVIFASVVASQCLNSCGVMTADAYCAYLSDGEVSHSDSDIHYC